eukprot:2897756-Rhodomonas_salina.3
MEGGREERRRGKEELRKLAEEGGRRAVRQAEERKSAVGKRAGAKSGEEGTNKDRNAIPSSVGESPTNDF